MEPSFVCPGTIATHNRADLNRSRIFHSPSHSRCDIWASLSYAAEWGDGFGNTREPPMFQSMGVAHIGIEVTTDGQTHIDLI